MDMHATDLVGINGITLVLLVYACQQGVYPRGHILPLRFPNIEIKICKAVTTCFLFMGVKLGPSHLWTKSNSSTY
jgi:hypothetical protein